MKLDLGFKSRYSGMMAQPAPEPNDNEETESPTCYPQMSIQGDAAKELAGKSGADAGDTITAMVTFRVVEVEQRVERSTEYGGPAGSTVDLEVISMENVKITGEEADEETAETAVDGFLKEKGLARKKN